MQILLVDEDVKLAMSLKRSLREYGFKVSVALDGASARKLIGFGGINLIITEINLPDMSGYELCRDIRSQNIQIPIIILTTQGAIESKLIGFETGADDYVVKPVEFSELLVRIKANIKRSYQSYDVELAESTQLTMADLTLDLRTKTVNRAGNKQINVTPREFALLEYFLRNKGTVLSREEITQNVWEMPTNVGNNLLNVYMNSLRKKIDKDFAIKLIHTRKGIGFVMKEYDNA
ncbi:response regulator transcription factor [Spirosoma foliorum]|uniref:Response regulator transcription factor n=1 Tax=Spirosoma foliorum TaxID=2710596 RepID=A0A7G5H2A9_9BACT|nr:response regulator transcription factor [Spirosoma foliorum]QMW05251.1 response regulator transcription factor [Spirosoma foliorum]